MDKLIEQLKRHEGLRLKPYRCSAGKLTIGIGRNIEDNGIREREAEYMLINDITDCIDELDAAFDWFAYLSPARADALINICFNIGLPRLLGFKKALYNMEQGFFNKAADEFLDSRWHLQVGARAVELADQIRTGEYNA